MARSAAIPLGFGAVGAILLISGIQNETIAEVIKGEFGKGTKHETPNPSEAELHGGQHAASFQGANASIESSGGFSSPTESQHEPVPGSQLPPQPRQAGARATQQVETEAVFHILQKRGIRPGQATNQQINEARQQYSRERSLISRTAEA